MRCGNHYSGREIALLHGKGHHRRRHHLIEQEGLDAGCRHNLCAVASEHIAVYAAVIADNGRRVFKVLIEIGGQAGCRLGDKHPVHPVWAGTQLASKASGAEAESCRAAVAQPGLVASVNQRQHLGASLWVWVLGCPGCCRG